MEKLKLNTYYTFKGIKRIANKKARYLLAEIENLKLEKYFFKLLRSLYKNKTLTKEELNFKLNNCEYAILLLCKTMEEQEEEHKN